MSLFCHIAAYRFVQLEDPAHWREQILTHASANGVLGTVLLAEEGINVMLSAPMDAMDTFWSWLCAQPPFAGLEGKRSYADNVGFRRLIVKVKPEIIRMNERGVKPQEGRAPAVDAQTLRRWLDAGHDDHGHPVVTLDTRNAFEVEYGRFRGAVTMEIERFGQFPAEVERLRDKLAGHTVVSYCTGGIRCEKAAIYLQEIGVPEVYQLDGGILRYFEREGGAHYEGTCFVFDDRIAVEPSLEAVIKTPENARRS
ncbi:MAG: sulfurtransferase [Deltaproteobacteria bacterium]|nr:sulfurtransferase [Deltaproteobacteria bacterium]